MSINNIIKAAVEPIVPVCVPDLYKGEEPVYCTFHYTEYPDGFSDDAPHRTKYDVQVHLFLPLGQNPIALRDRIKRALFAADFTWPSILNMTDHDYQHHVFECQYEGDL